MSVVTALSNDVGYKNIFIEQIENYYDTGDCIVLFSGSGSSENIIEICKYAQKKKINII